jgi:DNA polymerase-3 subunit beta
MTTLLEKSMILLFDRAAMLDAIADAASIAPVRSPKPVLMNVLLTIDPGEGSTVSATDMEVGIVRQVLGVKADAAVSLILPPARLMAILRGAEDDEVSLSAADGKVTLRGKGWHFTLPTEDPALFPAVPGFVAADYHAVAAADLRRLIRRTAYATDPESTRYALGGTLVVAGPDSLALVATDGRRLARQVVAAEPDPPAHVAVVANEGPTGALPPHAATVRTGRATIYSRLVEGRVPRYEDVFPAGAESVVTVAAGSLLDAATRAAICTSEETRGVEFAFAGDVLRISASAADVGQGEAEVAIVTLSGKPVTLALDARYLIDALKTLDREAVLRVELIDAKNAVLFKTEDRLDYVVMPLHIEG